MPDPEQPTPADLRFLKLLVGTLAGVMILGVVAIIALLVIRLSPQPPTLPTLPEGVLLPDGARPAAITFARDWLVVVTEGGTVLVFDRAGGAPVQRLDLP